MIQIKTSILAALLFFSAAASAGPSFRGSAFDAESGELLFTERRVMVMDGQRIKGMTIVYATPDGRTLGEKVLDFSLNPYCPDVELKVPESGFESGVWREGNTMKMYRTRDASSDEAKRVVRLSGNLTAETGLGDYLRANLHILRAGKRVTVRTIFPQLLSVVKFKARLGEEGRIGGRNIQRIELKSGLPMLGAGQSATLVFDSRTDDLVEYIGPSPLPGSAGVPTMVRIRYD